MSQLTTQTPTGSRIQAYLDAEGGSTDASVATIAEALEVSTTAVKTALAREEAGGRIEIDRRRRNQYAGDPTGCTIRAVGVSS